MSIHIDLQDHMTRNPISTVSALIAASGSPAAAYTAIANGQVYFDLERDLVIDEQAPVYRDETIWRADLALRSAPPIEHRVCGPVACRVGADVIHDGRPGKIVDVNDNSIWIALPGGCLQEIQRSAISGLVVSGRLSGSTHNAAERAQELIAGARPDELRNALADYATLKPWIQGQRQDGLPSRTLRRKLHAYRRAEAVLGHGLAGLLPKTAKRGNRSERLQGEVVAEIEKIVREDFLKEHAPTLTASLRLLNDRLRERGLPPTTLKTLSDRIRRLDPVKVALTRYGHKFANSIRPPHPLTDLPVAGDRAFEVGYVDSTPIDLKLDSGRTGEVLPPAWITMMLNANPPMPLGWHIAFKRADLETVLMAARDCVRRHNRLPNLLIHDLGSEHLGTAFDQLQAVYGVNFLRRPRGNPRFGAAMESFFNTLNQNLIHQLRGSTK